LNQNLLNSNINKRRKTLPSIKEGIILKELNEELKAIIEEKSIDNVFEYLNVVGQDSLTRFRDK
jgi:hypothetical protein